MAGVIQKPDAVMHATCEDCEWAYQRPLDAGDGLSEDDNEEIAARVARNHAYKCESTGDEWGATATVPLERVGGDGS